MRFILIILFGCFIPLCSKCQIKSRQDTINYLTNISLEYLNQVFNEHNIESAASLWDEQVFRDLKNRYLRCDSSGKSMTNTQILTVFKNTFYGLKGFEKRANFKIIDEAILASFENNEKAFFIQFFIENVEPLDSNFRYQSLLLTSFDKGRTWQVGEDGWVSE